MMRCPGCGNEIRPEDIFCGQCGRPNQASIAPEGAPGPVGMPSSARRSGLLPGAAANAGTRGTPSQFALSSRPQQPGSQFSGENPSSVRGAGSQYNEDFYQDATEAMPMPPRGNAPGSYVNYPQQDFPAAPAAPPGAAPSGLQAPPSRVSLPPMQTPQAGNYGASSYGQAPFGAGYGFDPTRIPPTPP
ncbi:MAG: zinc ribbon domain-containing protein, partial [Ktedonobacteraceae bacterium]|nr:zinc ribbon domain-containing protein [Ktedonobacteraceae bacterium]